MKPRILFITTHSPSVDDISPVDYWRVMLPYQYLKNKGYPVHIQSGLIPKEYGGKPLNKEVETIIEKIGESYDVIYSSYKHSPIFFSFLMVLYSVYKTKIIIDYDDNFLHQDKSSIMAQATLDQLETAEIIMHESPYLTVSTDLIREDIRASGRTKPTRVVPNYIDDTLYTASPKKHEGIVIGFYGSTSHQSDLYEKNFHQAINYIRKRYPVRFEIIGNFVPESMKGLGDMTLHKGSPEFNNWIKLYKKILPTWDITVAPLRKTRFNRSRSQIKYYETALAHLPLVASDIGVYREPVLLCKSKDDWIKYLSRLIEDKEYRLRKGEESYKDVKENYAVSYNGHIWEEALK